MDFCNTAEVRILFGISIYVFPQNPGKILLRIPEEVPVLRRDHSIKVIALSCNGAHRNFFLCANMHVSDAMPMRVSRGPFRFFVYFHFHVHAHAHLYIFIQHEYEYEHGHEYEHVHVYESVHTCTCMYIHMIDMDIYMSMSMEMCVT
jgi:hypothetical protein